MVHPRLRTVISRKQPEQKSRPASSGHRTPIRKKDADALADASEPPPSRCLVRPAAFRWSRTRKKSPPPLPPIEVPPWQRTGSSKSNAALNEKSLRSEETCRSLWPYDEITGVMPHIGALREERTEPLVKDQAKTSTWMSTTSTTTTCCFGTEVKSVWGAPTGILGRSPTPWTPRPLHRQLVQVQSRLLQETGTCG